MIYPEMKIECTRFDCKLTESGCREYSRMNPEACKGCKHAADPAPPKERRRNIGIGGGRTAIKKKGKVVMEKQEGVFAGGVDRLLSSSGETGKLRAEIKESVIQELKEIEDETQNKFSVVVEALLEEGLRVYREKKHRAKIPA